MVLFITRRARNLHPCHRINNNKPTLDVHPGSQKTTTAIGGVRRVRRAKHLADEFQVKGARDLNSDYRGIQ